MNRFMRIGHGGGAKFSASIGLNTVVEGGEVGHRHRRDVAGSAVDFRYSRMADWR